MELIAALKPAFIRFPGGSFVEGYTAGTYPVWRETVGEIAERKHFWNVWAYGTTNGIGYHESVSYTHLTSLHYYIYTNFFTFDVVLIITGANIYYNILVYVVLC